MAKIKVWQNTTSCSLLEAAYLVCDKRDPKWMNVECLPGDVRHIFRRLVFETKHFLVINTEMKMFQAPSTDCGEETNQQVSQCGHPICVRVRITPSRSEDLNNFRANSILIAELSNWSDRNGFYPEILFEPPLEDPRKLLTINGLLAETLAVQSAGRRTKGGRPIVGYDTGGIVGDIFKFLDSKSATPLARLPGFSKTTLQDTIKEGLNYSQKAISKLVSNAEEVREGKNKSNRRSNNRR